MTLKKAIYILKNHNRWRRGDNRVKPAEPSLLGEAIDTIVNYYEVDNILNKHCPNCKTGVIIPAAYQCSDNCGYFEG